MTHNYVIVKVNDLYLNTSLAHVKDEEAKTSEENDGQFLPIRDNAGFLAGHTVLVDHVLAGEDHPEHHEGGIEDSLK